MKEIEALTQDKTELVKQAEVRLPSKFVGNELKKPGHFVWQYDPATTEITKAKVETKASLRNGKVYYTNKVIMQPGCVYLQALNAKNAKKKFKQYFIKMLMSAKPKSKL